MRRIFSRCCARAASSQAAALPISAMNSRRFTRSPRLRAEASGNHVLSLLEHRRQPVLRQEVDDPTNMELMEGVGSYREPIGSLPHHCGESGIKLVGTANRNKLHCHAQRGCRGFPLFDVGGMRSVVRIPEKSDVRDGRKDLLEKL